jgi:hypothetical protein
LAVVLSILGSSGQAANAQSIYVAGSVGADILLVSGQESAGMPLSSGGGEAMSGAARLGVLFEDRFGVELEGGRAGEIRRSGGPLPLDGALSIFVPEMTFSTQVTTVSTTASIRQQVADSVALVYLGGVVFHRTDTSMEFGGFPILPFLVAGGVSARGSFFPPTELTVPSSRLTIASYRAYGVQYGAGPVVGFETHIGVGEHFRIMPGVRLHGLPSSWLVRPSVAAGWAF